MSAIASQIGIGIKCLFPPQRASNAESVIVNQTRTIPDRKSVLISYCLEAHLVWMSPFQIYYTITIIEISKLNY